MIYAKVHNNLENEKLNVFFPFIEDMEWTDVFYDWRDGIGVQVQWRVTKIEEGGFWVAMSKQYSNLVAQLLFVENGIPCLVMTESRVTKAICTDLCKNAQRTKCECSCGGNYHKMGLEGPNVLHFDGFSVALGVNESRRMLFPDEWEVTDDETKLLTDNLGDLLPQPVSQ